MITGWAGVVTIVALVVTLFADVVFICLMHAVIPWRRNVWGRHVMTFSYVLAVVLVLGLARFVFGDYPYRGGVLAASYVAFALVMCQRVYLTLREFVRGLSPRKE